MHILKIKYITMSCDPKESQLNNKNNALSCS